MPCSQRTQTVYGILYAATGKKYLDEAIQSAKSFKQNMPDIPYAICTDDPLSAENTRVFDKVIVIEKPHFHYLDKITSLKNSPFEKTLFLDTDTYCIGSCYELFEMLDRFDLAAAHSPVRESVSVHSDCPVSYPELNTGVIAFRKSIEVLRAIDNWQQIYSRQLGDGQNIHDQPAFRDAIYRSSLRVAVLTPEYNLRTCFPYFIGGNAAVKILHDRGHDISKVIAKIDKHTKKHSINPAVMQRSYMQRAAKKVAKMARWHYSRLKIAVYEKMTD